MRARQTRRGMSELRSSERITANAELTPLGAREVAWEQTFGLDEAIF